MPNFKLSRGIKDEITRQVDEKLTNKACIEEADFPLTCAGVQAAVMKPAHLTALRELKATGMEDLPERRNLAVWLSQDRMPSLERACIVQLFLPEYIYVPITRSFIIPTPVWRDRLEKEYRDMHLDIGVLDEADRAAVATWANRAVRARRLNKLARSVVEEILEKCTSTGEILANFPVLTTFVKDKMWRSRFRTPPARLMSYRREFSHPRKLEAAEIVLLGAEAMPAFAHDDTQVFGNVAVWRPLPNDPTFA